MNRRQGTEPSSSIDWLPWGLSIFGACCAVFVLVKGVLPERSANRELVQRVAKLETDLTRTRQSAVDDLSRAKDQLAQQSMAAQAEVSAAREQERLRAAREAARRDLGQELASEIASGDALILERAGELVVVLRERLLFASTASTIEPRGKRSLRALAESMRRLPAEQVYRIGGTSEKHQRAVGRFLEIAGRVPHAQLAAAGPPPAEGEVSQGPPNVEIVLVHRKR
jgi:outer membrane protein OmpA-like peptidoglycan-associated protein